MDDMGVDQILSQAKLYENSDDFERSVALYYKAFDQYKQAKDVESSVYCIDKIIKILRRESEFYKVAEGERTIADFYFNNADLRNAGRHYSRAGVAFISVNAFNEAADAYARAGDMFFDLKGEFYVEAAKYYKLSTICYINVMGRQSVDYQKAFDNALKSYREAKETKFINVKSHLLYLANFYADVQEALSRNGFYREERELYIKKMDYLRLGYRISKGERWKYVSTTVWKYACLYGESSLLWMGWICVHMFSFAALYYFMKLVTKNGMPLSFRESIFFAVDIFATLGFGSYELVSDTARFVAALDVLSGYFMMAMLITIFTRRLTR